MKKLKKNLPKSITAFSLEKKIINNGTILLTRSSNSETLTL